MLVGILECVPSSSGLECAHSKMVHTRRKSPLIDPQERDVVSRICVGGERVVHSCAVVRKEETQNDV